MNENEPQVTNTEDMITTEATQAPTPTQTREANEREAFIRHTQDQGEPIPENFADAGAWYDSLKEAQGQYTQSRQELAQLKEQYNENGVTNPSYSPDGSEAEAAPVEEAAPDVETLKIDAPTEESTEESEASEPAIPAEEVTVGEWNDWGNIIDANNGEPPEALRNAIKMRLNVDDKIIDDYLSQRSSVQQQNVSAAAELVGGQEELNKIIGWAGNNLTEDERNAVNGQLAGPGYKTAVLGLKARYETSDSVSAARGREPGVTPNRTSNANAFQGVTPYASDQEMFADQRNPRYRTDARFREAVMQRIVATNEHGYRV